MDTGFKQGDHVEIWGPTEPPYQNFPFADLVEGKPNYKWGDGFIEKILPKNHAVIFNQGLDDYVVVVTSLLKKFTGY